MHMPPLLPLQDTAHNHERGIAMIYFFPQGVYFVTTNHHADAFTFVSREDAAKKAQELSKAPDTIAYVHRFHIDDDGTPFFVKHSEWRNGHIF